MSLQIVPTSVLDAVNEMLTAIGTVPVNTLDAPGSSDVAIARDTLEAIHREVLSRGWWFNTAFAYSLAPSGGEITVPPEILSLRPSRGLNGSGVETQQFYKRGNKLARMDGSLNFSSTVNADVVFHREFMETPESARRYIVIRAARIFQTKVLGDDTLGVFNQLHEQEAWDILVNDHATSNPVSDMYMQRVRRVGQQMRTPPRQLQNPNQNQGGNQQ